MQEDLKVLKKFYPNAHPDFRIMVNGTPVFHITDGMGEFIAIFDDKACALPYALNHEKINNAMRTKEVIT